MSPDTSSYFSIDQMDQDDIFGEKLISQSIGPHNKRRQKKYSTFKRFLGRYWLWFSHGILLCISFLFLCLWIEALRQKYGLPVYSPANIAVEYKKELTIFNGTFDFPSAFRGNPTPAVDEAWHRISEDAVKPLRLTEEQLLKVGKRDTPSKVKFLDEDGAGYMAALEVNHQLHCLNVLRKYTYHEYYETFDPVFVNTKPDVFRMHLDHCVEILRQSLMCHADVGIIVYEWVKGWSRPYPDFNVKHQCRNFEKLLAWKNENTIHVPRDHIIRLTNEVDLEEAP